MLKALRLNTCGRSVRGMREESRDTANFFDIFLLDDKIVSHFRYTGTRPKYAITDTGLRKIIAIRYALIPEILRSGCENYNNG